MICGRRDTLGSHTLKETTRKLARYDIAIIHRPEAKYKRRREEKGSGV